MTDEVLVEALYRARQTGRAGPELADPGLIGAEGGLEHGLELQLAVLNRLLASGERLGRWRAVFSGIGDVAVRFD